MGAGVCAHEHSESRWGSVLPEKRQVCLWVTLNLHRDFSMGPFRNAAVVGWGNEIGEGLRCPGQLTSKGGAWECLAKAHLWKGGCLGWRQGVQGRKREWLVDAKEEGLVPGAPV